MTNYNREGAIEALVAEGADVNAKDKLGEMPLHKAAGEGRLSIVKALIEAGADPNAKKRTR